ncbi:MAG: hypothetical protein IPI42_14700 [Saprospiraceae bacterium]|nr:hypothetical protein [Candidatus Parvibacillus calidus]
MILLRPYRALEVGAIHDWEADQYLWEVLIGDKLLMRRTFVLDAKGTVSSHSNLLDLFSTALYVTDESEPFRYLKTFNSHKTAKIFIRLSFKRKFTESKNLEFNLVIFNGLTGQLEHRSSLIFPILPGKGCRLIMLSLVVVKINRAIGLLVVIFTIFHLWERTVSSGQFFSVY